MRFDIRDVFLLNDLECHDSLILGVSTVPFDFSDFPKGPTTDFRTWKGVLALLGIVGVMLKRSMRELDHTAGENTYEEFVKCIL
jgi:hypothetical protein